MALNALAGVLLAVPIVGYLASAARKKEMIEALAWIPLGDVDRIPRRPDPARDVPQSPHKSVGRTHR